MTMHDVHLSENAVGSKAANNGRSDNNDCWISGLRLVRYFKTASQTYVSQYEQHFIVLLHIYS